MVKLILGFLSCVAADAADPQINEYQAEADLIVERAMNATNPDHLVFDRTKDAYIVSSLVQIDLRNVSQEVGDSIIKIIARGGVWTSPGGIKYDFSKTIFVSTLGVSGGFVEAFHQFLSKPFQDGAEPRPGNRGPLVLDPSGSMGLPRVMYAAGVPGTGLMAKDFGIPPGQGKAYAFDRQMSSGTDVKAALADSLRILANWRRLSPEDVAGRHPIIISDGDPDRMAEFAEALRQKRTSFPVLDPSLSMDSADPERFRRELMDRLIESGFEPFLDRFASPIAVAELSTEDLARLRRLRANSLRTSCGSFL